MNEQTSQPAAPQPAKSGVVPLRALVINLLFSMFTSLVIFAVASYYFLVPQMVRHEAELRRVQAQISEMDQRTAAAEEAAAEAQAGEQAAAAPEAPAAPAAAPAPEAAPAQPAAATAEAAQ